MKAKFFVFLTMYHVRCRSRRFDCIPPEEDKQYAVETLRSGYITRDYIVRQTKNVAFTF